MAIKRRQTVWLLGGIAWLLLAGCAQKDEKSQTQVLARVNNAEITVLELNSVLSQRPDLKGDSNNQRQQALDYLVDQEVLVQKAADLKLDQEPAVLAAIEAGRRQVLAAAAAQKVLKVSTAKPSEHDVSHFYAQHPSWFAERKLFDFVSFTVASATLNPKLLTQLDSAKQPDQLAAQLSASNASFKQGTLQLSSGQISDATSQTLEKMQPGTLLVNHQGDQTLLMQLLKIEDAPVDEKSVREAIAQQLLKQWREQATQAQLDILKKGYKISYLKKFSAPSAAGAAVVATPGKSQLQNGLKGEF